LEHELGIRKVWKMEKNRKNDNEEMQKVVEDWFR
jgi:hypothetical protein